LRKNAESTDKNAEFPRQNISILAEHKLLALLVPARLGGAEATAEEFMEVAQCVAEACGSTGMIYVMHCCAVEVMSKHLAGADTILSAVVRGEHFSSLACSERGSGANFYASLAQSKASPNGFKLDGEKCFVTSGGQADSYVVSTRAVGSDDSVNTSLYVLEKSNPGVSFAGKWQGLGLRGNSSVNMILQDCEVPKNALIGDQGQGLAIEMGTLLPRFLLGSASVYNGIASAALKSAIEHTKSRVHAHTGEGLSALPVLRSKIAQMQISVNSSITYTRAAAKAMDCASESTFIDLLSAKQLACTTAVNVAGLAMEITGGIAYSGALSVERHFRDAQAGIVMAPTNAMLLDLVGRAALGMPLM
jgi:alkylation response protein AidB-like acyl-CoA dehydrogenase